MLRNLYFLCLLTISLFSLTKQINAFDTFTKSDFNPLPIAYLPNYSTGSQSHIFKRVQNFEGVFAAKGPSGIYNIVYGKSDNGIEWNIEKILAATSNHLSSPRLLLLDGNPTKLFFTKDEPGQYKTYFVNCTSSLECETNLNLALQSEYEWERTGIVSAFPYFKNNQYFLFYVGFGGYGRFNLSLATSSDGQEWIKCSSTPFLTSVDNPFLLEKDSKYYLFFHSPYGIRYVESTDPLGCNMNWSSPTTVLTSSEWYDQNSMIAPTVLSVDQSIYLYYAGLGTDNTWHINLAVSGQQPVPKNPIVILPGFLGSWNKDAVVYQQQVNYSDWKMNPVVEDYTAIRDTLINIGLQENNDFYFFSYDWRKKLDDSTTDLNSFITQTVKPSHPNSKINLLGHSLGGLVARIFGQKLGTADVNKIITVGSPHQGTAQAYKAVEAGTLERGNDLNGNLLWLAQKLALKLYTDGINTDRYIINTYFPSVKDIFPIYQFLTAQDNQPILIDQMTVKNDTLLSYKNSFPSLYPKIQTFAGEKGNTLSGYQVKSRTPLDEILDLYPDGSPQLSQNQMGDYLITSYSAKADTDGKILTLDHGELIYKKEGIKEILDSLGRAYTESQIIEGTGTKINPSLLLLLLSPATIEVDFQGQTYSESDGMILIPDAQTGDYQLRVKGKNPGGPYTVLIGQVGTSSDVWSDIVGIINPDSPESQTDTYALSFNSQTPKEFPVNPENTGSLFDLLIKRLQTLNQNDRNIDQAINFLTDGKNAFSNSNWPQLRKNLLSTHQNIFQSLNQNYLDAIFELENLYNKSLGQTDPKPSQSQLERELDRYQKTASSLESSLLADKKRGEDVIQAGNHLLILKEHLEKAKEALDLQNYHLVEILLETCKGLIGKVR